MSKAHDPHWRYIAFRVDADRPLSRRAIGNAVSSYFRKAGWPEEELPRLTRFEWPHAIVRVHHHRQADCRRLLGQMTSAIDAAARVPVGVETLSASGTIKTLTDRLGILKQR